MADNPLVSILVNAYNAEHYISQTLDSALAQTYKNVEIIVLDDHSTDRTAEIVKRYIAKDQRVHYVLPEKRLGLIEGRNEMLRLAKGELITYLDADDIYLPSKVNDEVEYLAAHPEYAVVYCNIGYFFDGLPQELYHHRYHFYSGDEVFSQLLEKMFITNTAVMFRRKVYDTLGGYRTDLGIVEDWEYFLRLTYGGYRVAFLDRDLVHYRLRWDSHTNFKRQAQVQESAVKIFEDLKRYMSDADRARYRIDHWVAKRKETYAVALVATGEGREARMIVEENARYIRPFKKITIRLLSILPASLVGFLIEQAWKMKKKNLFVPTKGA